MNDRKSENVRFSFSFRAMFINFYCFWGKKRKKEDYIYFYRVNSQDTLSYLECRLFQTDNAADARYLAIRPILVVAHRLFVPCLNTVQNAHTMSETCLIMVWLAECEWTIQQKIMLKKSPPPAWKASSHH